MNVMKIIVIYFLYAIFLSLSLSLHFTSLHFLLHFHQQQPDPEVPAVPAQVAASKATHVIILHNKLHVFSL